MATDTKPIADRYRIFAHFEAKGRSAAYEALAGFFADSELCLHYVSQFPSDKQQPNLVFAALRKIAGVPDSQAAAEAALATHGGEIAKLVLARRTQTNEPARCAALFMALSKLTETDDRPIALIELGASAGLCLLPDFYRYRLNGIEHRPQKAAREAPLMSCDVTGKPAFNIGLTIGWRCGQDIHPIDIADASQRDWLETLIWPGHDHRLARLQSAMQETQNHNFDIETSDAVDGLEALIDKAPPDMNVVVYHGAVMNYLPQARVEEFVTKIRALPVHWISQEDPHLFADFTDGQNNKIQPADMLGRFALALDSQLLAHTHPHGDDDVWLAGD
jgi:hypothetical protein